MGHNPNSPSGRTKKETRRTYTPLVPPAVRLHAFGPEGAVASYFGELDWLRIKTTQEVSKPTHPLINRHPKAAPAILGRISAARRRALVVPRSNGVVRQDIPAIALVPVLHPAQGEAEPGARGDAGRGREGRLGALVARQDAGRVVDGAHGRRPAGGQRGRCCVAFCVHCEAEAISADLSGVACVVLSTSK